MDYRKSKLEERYFNDASFHKLVSALHDMIANNGFTPSELREATFLAHYKYEMENPRALNYKVQASMAEYWNLKDPK